MFFYLGAKLPEAKNNLVMKFLKKYQSHLDEKLLLENNLIHTDSLIANSASGVSGAGRQAKVANLFSEMSE